jgi:hypothetical protein
MRPGPQARLLVLAAVCLSALMQACAGSSPVASAAASPSASPGSLSISNATTMSVLLVVNGSVIETVAPGGYEDPVRAVLPPLPWAVETRTTSGRVLSQMTVHAGDVWYTTPDPSGSSISKGDGVRVDLSCGELDVWSGPPLIGPVPGPGESGDCRP